MNFINSCKKINFSFFLFLVIFVSIVSATFGTIISSAKSGGNQQTQESGNLQKDGAAKFFGKNNLLNLFAERGANQPLDIAATFTVKNLNDAGAGSLRKAVADANAAAGDDVIDFDPALTGTITLTTGELSITSNISIIKSGASVIAVSGNNASRVFNIAAGATVTIDNLSIVNGKGEGSGGGVLNAGTLNLSNSIVSGNTAIYTGTSSGNADGGGISNSGTLNIQTATITNNTASVTNLGTASGGGISNTGTAAVVNSSVISNNSIGKPDARGGGISNTGMFTLSNSTVGNNSASSSSANSNGQGGGIYNAAPGALTVRNSTIGFNTASAFAADGGGIFNTAGTVTIGNTIVSNNNTTNNGTTTARDISGTVSSAGNNLISNATGSAGWAASDKLNQPSFITQLGNYGGPTQTFALLPNSPAIDMGNNANAPATDQRGSVRIVNGTIDIGAFENNPTGVVDAIPNGAVGASYNQQLATAQSSALTFALVSGVLPPGLSLSASGAITGTPTTGGTYTFGVSITSANGFVNYKQYTVFIPFTIVNLNDSGAGSLRRAIIDANASPGDDTLTFQSDVSGTLTLISELQITSNINIIGTGANNLIINGNGTSRVFNISANSNVGISGVSIRNGSVEGSGAGILNAGTLSLSNVVIHDNAAVYSGSASGNVAGGGISNSGMLTLYSSTVRNNTVQSINLGTASGGGISNTGTVTLINSTISSNSSLGKPNSYGGGISNNGTFNIINSTVGLNTAAASPAVTGSSTSQGGGIWNGAQGVLTVRNSTIGFNTVNAATAGGGGIFNAGSVTIGNTIVSDNSVITGGSSVISDVSGTVTSAGNNLISNATDSAGWAASDILNQPSLLTPLGNYGGPTQTFGILQSSPAINGGNNANAPPTDQRGSARIVGGAIDIGSFENNPTGVIAAVNNGAVDVSYTQQLATAQSSTLTFALVSGALPPGLSLSASGAITGTPTTGGTYIFSVAVTDANGVVNFKEYALVIGCTFAINPTGLPFSAAGGTGTFEVITQNGCFYRVSGNNASIITITSGPTGSGSGTVTFTVSANTGPERVGTITVAGLTFTVNQASGCVFTLSPTGSTFTPGGGMGSFNVTTPNPECTWTATTNVSWIIINTASGTGNGMVSFTVQANNGSARTGTITVGGQTYTVNQSSACSYTISPTGKSVGSAGGTGSFTVTTAAGCTYTAVSSVPWITINSGGSGSGSGTVSFTVAANAGGSRTGTITVGGEIFTVTQEGGCTYSLSAASANIPQNGGTGSVNVTAAAGCDWTAVSNVPWITITSGATGSGNGTVNFTVAANAGAPRSGTLTIAGQTFTVNQTGCGYVLSPTATTFAADGGSGSFNVTVTEGCSWTAVSNASWISIVSGGSGSGNGSVTFTVQPNVGPQRTGTISVSGQTFTITQTGGCSYSIFPTSVIVSATADTGSFNLNVGGGCEYTVVSNAAWITITSAASGNGSGLITFSVQANSGAARSGTITVGGQTFTVNQSAFGTVPVRPAFDFDGDGKADISVFRPDGGVWYLLNSASGFTGAQFGASTDKIVPADYDGDGKTDLAVYRAGTWYLNRSTAGFTGVAFGASDDIPQPSDFDGDGKADLAVWRPSSGTWYVYNLVNGQFTATQFGASTDKPVASDYDGDRKADYAVFRPSNGTWYVQGSQSGFSGMQFGSAEDKPVPADYDGDGKTDVAVFRPSSERGISTEVNWDLRAYSSAFRQICRWRRIMTATAKLMWRCLEAACGI